MDKERQNAYYRLVNTLLTCASGKELEILQAHPDLLDAGLVKTIRVEAKMLAERGDENGASRLRSFIVLIATAMGNLPTPLEAIADKLLHQGVEQFQSSQFEAAIEFLQKALTIYREIENHIGEAYSLNNLGEVYRMQGKYYIAIDYYQQSLTINPEKGNSSSIAAALNNLGLTYHSLGQYQKAIDYHEQSLLIKRNIGDRSEIALAVGNLGNAYDCLGQCQNAIKHYQESLEIDREIGNSYGVAASLVNLGKAYLFLGQYQNAIKHFQDAINIAVEIDNKYVQAKSLSNMGNAYQLLGQYQMAINYHQQSLAIKQEIGNREGEANSLNSLGNAYDYQKKYQMAIDFYHKSLDIAQELGYRHGESNSLGNLGNLCYSQRQYQEAIKLYQQTIATKREIGDLEGVVNYLNNLGLVYNSLEQYQDAIKSHQESLTIAQEIDSPLGEGASLNNLGFALLRFNKLANAENTLSKAIEVWESLRLELDDTLKISIFEEQARTYQLLQEVLIAQNQYNAALAIAERGRARAFVELLAERLSLQSTNQLAITPPTLQEIQQIAKEQKSILVEYSIVDSENLLLIWVIKPNGEIAFRQVALEPLKQQNTSLSDLVLQARKSLGIKDHKEKLRGVTVTTTDEPPALIKHISQPLRQLYEYLIVPIINLLPDDPNAPVIFIPQGSLFLVPLPALQNAAGKFLIEHHTILTAPSIQTLKLTRQQREQVGTIHESPLQSQDVLVVGNPTMPTIPLTQPPQQLIPLPGAEAEAKVIASLLNTQAIIGDKATKIHIEELMPNARLIHLATHGLLNDIKQLGVPGAIALAPSDEDNGFLTAGEILEMKLNAELVVLSACSSGQGKITGDGVIGLSRCLFAAGVPSVIVSLWKVGDNSTQFLMSQFYQNLQSGMNKAQALRQAMLTTMKKKQYSRPKSWAAFTLIGEAE